MHSFPCVQKRKIVAEIGSLKESLWGKKWEALDLHFSWGGWAACLRVPGLPSRPETSFPHLLLRAPVNL